MLRITIVMIVCIASSFEARAQSFSLPKVDDVVFSLQGGNFISPLSSEGEWRTERDGEGDRVWLFGWGFETIFQMTEGDKWDVELAVGYDQLSVRAAYTDRFRLRGTIRNLPSISAYAQHTDGYYIGLGTGLTTLSNVAAYENGQRMFTISGDTFSLAAKAGWVIQRLDGFFIEGAYHVRKFNGLNFGAGAPPDLPATSDASGFVFSIGYQFSTKSRTKTAATDDEVKKEADRQRKIIPQPSLHALPTQTVCTDAVPAGWFVVDDGWDAARCAGAPGIATNVFTISDPSGAAVGDVIDVCSNSPVPANWEVVAKRWMPTRCGRPALVVENVTRIRRKPDKEPSPTK